MSDQASIAELQAKLAALQKERDEIKEYLSKVKKKEARLVQLAGSMWHGDSHGEIARVKRDLRNLHFPKFESGQWTSGLNVRRIIEVNEKWIVLRYDTSDDKTVSRYRRDTGWKQGTRSGYDTIDVAKALEIWEAHQKAQK